MRKLYSAMNAGNSVLERALLFERTSRSFTGREYSWADYVLRAVDSIIEDIVNVSFETFSPK